jgi:hypothetical protein
VTGMWTVEVKAGCRWNDTGIPVSAGRRYSLSAAGEWFDWRNRHGPEGGPSSNLALRMAERLRRAPAQNWFALMGAIDRDSRTSFLIGSGLDWQAPSDGRVFAFANDVWAMYFNNSGAVTLQVSLRD